MSSPDFHSVHLGADSRRTDFRRARQQLLAARGDHTVLAEKAGLSRVLLNHSMVLSPAQTVPLPTECRFVLVDGDLVYPLKVGINTIGRFLDSDVFLCERYISRRHCVVLIHTNGTCDLHDTASRNGTELNGQRLTQPRALCSGDVIRLCDREFVFLRLDDVHAKKRTSVDHDTQLD